MENPHPVDLNERCYPGMTQKRVLADHLARYEFACGYVKGATVVDLGCGEGYGAEMLRVQGGAVDVIGIDADELSIKAANKKYPLVEFRVNDATKTEIPDGFADVVVCFEVWHHLLNYDQLIPEIFRILKKGGILVLSVPNQKVIYLNPFHKKMLTKFYCKDFDREIIEAYINKYFVIKKWYGQRFVKALFANVVIRSIFGIFDITGLFGERISHIYKLANGPQVLPLGIKSARILVVVAEKKKE